MPSPYPAPTSDATPTRRGLMGIAAQTFAGAKSFLDAIKLALRTSGTLPAGGAELEGSILYNTTTKRTMVHDGISWVPVVMSITEGTGTPLEEHIISVGAHTATKISYVPGGLWEAPIPLTSPDVRNALDELNVKKVTSETLAAGGGAALVGATPSGNLSGTDVQTQLVELDAEKASGSALSSIGGAALVGATASGGLSSTTVQGQLNELDSEKLATNSPFIPRVLVIVKTDGLGGVTTIWQEGITSVAISGTDLLVTFSTPFIPVSVLGDDPNYIVGGWSYTQGRIVQPRPASFTSNSVKVLLHQEGTGTVNLSNTAAIFFVLVYGRQ